MRAVRVTQFGGPEVLKVETNVPIPTPSPSQVLVKVKAAGINPIDAYIRSGQFIFPPTLPYIPGSDVAGVVKEIGNKVTKFKPGDRVFVVNHKQQSGGYAEFMVSEENLMGHLPDDVTFQEGAGIGIPCYTAYRAFMLREIKEMKPGDHVLIHGASGAVGLACVQIAVSRGLKVLGTAGSQAGLDLVQEQGAAAVFNHNEDGYVDKILECTGGLGPDLIIEMLANVNLASDLKLINKNGVIMIVGSSGPVKIDPFSVMLKGTVVTGMALLNTTQDEWSQMHAGVLEGLNSGQLKPHVCKEYDLINAPKAHEEIINNKGSLGKRVIVL